MTAFNYSPPASLRNRLSAYGRVSGTPYGYLAPISWVLPNAPGAMRTIAASSSVGTVTMAGGRAIEATAAGISSGSVAAGAIVPIVASAAATSTGTITLAGIAAILASGAGVSTSSISLGGIINILAAAGVSTSTGSVNLTALGYIIASGGGAPALSPEGLAQAVWQALLTDYPDIGTMGKALADAGGAGNPWSSDLATNNTAGTFGERVQKLLTQAKYLGLK